MTSGLEPGARIIPIRRAPPPPKSATLGRSSLIGSRLETYAEAPALPIHPTTASPARSATLGQTAVGSTNGTAPLRRFSDRRKSRPKSLAPPVPRANSFVAEEMSTNGRARRKLEITVVGAQPMSEVGFRNQAGSLTRAPSARPSVPPPPQPSATPSPTSPLCSPEPLAPNAPSPTRPSHVPAQRPPPPSTRPPPPVLHSSPPCPSPPPSRPSPPPSRPPFNHSSSFLEDADPPKENGTGSNKAGPADSLGPLGGHFGDPDAICQERKYSERSSTFNGRGQAGVNRGSESNSGQKPGISRPAHPDPWAAMAAGPGPQDNAAYRLQTSKLKPTRLPRVKSAQAIKDIGKLRSKGFAPPRPSSRPNTTSADPSPEEELPDLPPRPEPGHPLYHYTVRKKKKVAGTPRATGLANYRPMNEDELAFLVGDSIDLHSRLDGNWYIGSIGGGLPALVPINYIQVVQDLPDCQEEITLTNQDELDTNLESPEEDLKSPDLGPPPDLPPELQPVSLANQNHVNTNGSVKKNSHLQPWGFPDSESHEQLPDKVEKVPVKVEQVPVKVEQVSEKVEQVSEKVEQVPKKVEQVPEKVEQVPEKVEQVPKKVEQVSEKVEQVPEKVEQVSEKVEQVPVNVEQVSEKVEQVPVKVEQVSEKVTAAPASRSHPHTDNGAIDVRTYTDSQTNSQTNNQTNSRTNDQAGWNGEPEVSVSNGVSSHDVAQTNGLKMEAQGRVEAGRHATEAKLSSRPCGPPAFHVPDLVADTVSFGIVVYEFVGDRGGDLCLRVGDRVKITGQESPEWLTGELRGKTGVFPASFVDITTESRMEPRNAEKPEPVLVNIGPSADVQQVLVHLGPSAKVAQSADSTGNDATECAAVVSHHFQGLEGELSFEAGDKITITGRVNKEWLSGKMHGVSGMFPEAFLLEVPLPYRGGKDGKVHPSPQCQKNASLKVAMAMYDHFSQTPGDLCFAAGDKVVIQKTIDQSWAEGSVGDRSGMFPLSFVQVLSPGDRFLEALYDFSGTKGELSFKAGDILQFVAAFNEDWIVGRLHGENGRLPANFVRDWSA